MKRIITAACITIAISIGFVASVHAADMAITGGTNGTSCDSGGYFTPKLATVTSGDTVTISVPASDPYAGGLEIHGFVEGNFVVLPGKSHTTKPITSSVSYYGIWPSSGCMKGSGMIAIAGDSSNTTAQPPAVNDRKTVGTASVQSAAVQPVSATVWVIIAASIVTLGIVAGFWIAASKHRE